MRKIILLFSAMLIFLSSCGDFTGTGTPSKSFDNKLQGTWVSNDTSVYSGELLIGYDRITITGYSEGQTPPALLGGNDNERPFKGFTKGVALKGYSEEGKIFIENGGAVQEGIPYVYDEDKSYPPKYKLLHFKFGGRDEILECK
ncbi:MAG: hypothetical protein LBH20_11510 [Treponema sp.]|nr:hypothetical protein [Treponema sp.]